MVTRGTAADDFAFEERQRVLDDRRIVLRAFDFDADEGRLVQLEAAAEVDDHVSFGVVEDVDREEGAAG